MKKIYSAAIVLVILSGTGCASLSGLLKQKVTVGEAISYKVAIDNAANPARKHVLLESLRDKRISIPSATVKRVDASSNIDYDFEVVLEMSTSKGMVECYVYSHDVKKLADLKAGTTRISVEGDFSRFFTMLDEYYTKIEIVNSSIQLVN
ncbi:MAG: hypothetical protein ACOC2H_07270 [Spirochaetota bacterium]